MCFSLICVSEQKNIASRGRTQNGQEYGGGRTDNALHVITSAQRLRRGHLRRAMLVAWRCGLASAPAMAYEIEQATVMAAR